LTVVQMIGGLALGLLAACAGVAHLFVRVRALEAGDVARRRARGEWGPPPPKDEVPR